MNTIPKPIFDDQITTSSWKKIYEREYGVQYAEVSIALLAFAKEHFPHISYDQVVIPGGDKNISFYINDKSWKQLVAGLNKKYTANVEKLEEYEKQFTLAGLQYVKLAKKIATLDLQRMSDLQLLTLFLQHREKKNRYLAYGWSSFILNNYVADHATEILNHYIKNNHLEEKRELLVTSLFKPKKLAAILKLQQEVQNLKGKMDTKKIEDLYNRYNWIPCLDIQNKPWSKSEFKEQIKSFSKKSTQQTISFEEIMYLLHPTPSDKKYFEIAQRFVYIKDARDDFRRESMFYTHNLWIEIGKRMGLKNEECTYLLDEEIITFLKTKIAVSERKNGFVLYLDKQKELVCLQGNDVKKALTAFCLLPQKSVIQKITGITASRGNARGKVVIVKGIKDLALVTEGSVLVAVTTHPDYVSAMRKAVAIVTDEGGVTSHAAIVAREFGIPCIVGTKIATHVFKNGDEVVVETENGTIKKI